MNALERKIKYALDKVAPIEEGNGKIFMATGYATEEINYIVKEVSLKFLNWYLDRVTKYHGMLITDELFNLFIEETYK